MALSLRPAASLAAPPAHLRPRRRATSVSVVRATVSPPPALDSRRRPQNVSGEFFVDHRCIDCATCRWMAPEVFKRVDGQSAVAAQPTSEEIRTKALQALLSCPTSSIHTDKPAEDILQVENTFPLPIDDDLPGVYLCGYHSENSYGATSYLIVHPEGNIMVDSPRYTPKLANQLEKLGGVRYMFLTHIDDVADHRKWAERLKCQRIIHSGDVEDITADVEWKLTGNGPWNIGTNFELIHTPGHTEGSVCLLYKPLKALFTGDHVAKSEESDDLNLFLVYSKQSVGVQMNSIRKLLDVDFEWFLPGLATESGMRMYMPRIQLLRLSLQTTQTKEHFMLTNFKYMDSRIKGLGWTQSLRNTNRRYCFDFFVQTPCTLLYMISLSWMYKARVYP